MLVFVFRHHHRVNLRQILRGQSVLEQVLFDLQQAPNQIFLLAPLVASAQMSRLNQSNKELFKIHKMATFDKEMLNLADFEHSKVELGLGAELPSPPGSMTSRSVQSSASSKKSAKSNRSRDYA